MMNSISHGSNNDVTISDNLNNVITYMGRSLLLNSINIGFTIRIYTKKRKFYRPNYCTVFNSILSSTVTSKKWQLVKYFNNSINLSFCEFS